MKNPKNILMCIPGTYISGAEMTNIETLKLLKKKGYQLHCIINGWNDGAFKKILINEGINFTEVKVGAFYLTKIWWTLDTLIHFIPGIFSFFYTYFKVKPDIIYFSGKWHFYLFARWLNHKTILYREHDYPAENRRNWRFYKSLHKNCDVVIVDSIYIKTRIIEFGISAIKIIIAPSLIKEHSDYTPDLKETDQINIAIVGQILARKGHDILINALKLLPTEIQKQIKLFVIGNNDTQYTSTLKSLITEKHNYFEIQWTGNVDGATNFYKTYEIDLVVVPSRIEAFGRVALEPAFSAIPVIASNTGGLPEIVWHEKTGLLFEKENVAHLATHIKNYLSNRSLMREHGLSARKNAVFNFSYDSLAEKTLSAFK